VSSQTPSMPPGWYSAQGDPPSTQRWWDGQQWVGGPQMIEPAPGAVPSGSAWSPGPGPAMPSYGVAVRPSGPGGRTLAEPGQRIIARLIDWAIVFVALLVLAAISGTGNGTGGLILLFAVVTIAYEIAFVALKGATPGKMMLGLGVITEGGTVPPGWGPAALRWLMGAIPYVAFVIWLVSLVFLFNDPEHRTVADRVAKTRVIRTK
jgi:uncharacterized RDD family membrane protein YckC